eukprot:CAMPEP_0177627252 /NCGR_PEP_ID=MMETSP0419_2-20121207/31102_1 /TAXON_ID=582737 /ORGANISM="Tetraselmis sp., Strain GSL018" /LENGTH=550 /DNA_ID=CAMNT_0019128389 /DNA_START=596 /DNA_END=2248 /DNA_ORIENTATION=-
MPISKFEEQKVRQGDPAAFLPILHYSLISFSKPLAREIVENNYELNGKTDLRFLESVWKLLRELVNYKPALSVNQFLSQGFAERKILTVCDIVALCRQRHSELLRQAGKHAGKRRPIGHSAGIPSAHIWGSPVKKEIDGIAEHSPPRPRSAPRQAKRKGPKGSRAPKGQVDMLAGSEVPRFEVVREHSAREKQRPDGNAAPAEPPAGGLPPGAVSGHPFFLAEDEDVEEAPRPARPVPESQDAAARGGTGPVQAERHRRDEGQPRGWEGPTPARSSRPRRRASPAWGVKEGDAPDASRRQGCAAEPAKDPGGARSDQEASLTVNCPKVAPGAELEETTEAALVPCQDPNAGAGLGHGGDRPMELQPLLEVLSGLQARLSATEAQLSEAKEATKSVEQTLQARVTLLEGRVRFLESELEESRQQARPPLDRAGTEGAANHSAGGGQPRQEDRGGLLDDGSNSCELCSPLDASSSSFERGDVQSFVKIPTDWHAGAQHISWKPPSADPGNSNGTASVSQLQRTKNSKSGGTSDFVSSIAGRFEAARALLESM